MSFPCLWNSNMNGIGEVKLNKLVPFCLPVWREATRWRRWRSAGRRPSSSSWPRISSSPGCTDPEAAGPRVRTDSLLHYCSNSLEQLYPSYCFVKICKELAGYTLWQKSVKTMICLNLSFATVTSRLVPPRRPLSWDSLCGDDGHIHSFLSDCQSVFWLKGFTL